MKGPGGVLVWAATTRVVCGDRRPVRSRRYDLDAVMPPLQGRRCDRFTAHLIGSSRGESCVSLTELGLTSNTSSAPWSRERASSASAGGVVFTTPGGISASPSVQGACPCRRAHPLRQQRDRRPEELVSAKRDLAEANIAAYVDKVLSKAPPLTPDQRTRLAELLRPVRVAAGDAA